MHTADKWNQRYENIPWNIKQLAQPAFVLRNYSDILPQSGTALDLACGQGGNALWLAQRGLNTVARDISSVAIERLARQACYFHLPITAEVCDLSEQPLACESYDVIVASYYLDRDLFPLILNALKPNGLLYYQTFVQTPMPVNGPKNPLFRLEKNELLKLCAGLQILIYLEQSADRKLCFELEDEALLVAAKS